MFRLFCTNTVDLSREAHRCDNFHYNNIHWVELSWRSFEYLIYKYVHFLHSAHGNVYRLLTFARFVLGRITFASEVFFCHTHSAMCNNKQRKTKHSEMPFLPLFFSCRKCETSYISFPTLFSIKRTDSIPLRRNCVSCQSEDVFLLHRTIWKSFMMFRYCDMKTFRNWHFSIMCQDKVIIEYFVRHGNICAKFRKWCFRCRMAKPQRILPLSYIITMARCWMIVIKPLQLIFFSSHSFP